MRSRYTSLFRFFFVCVDLLILNLLQLLLLNSIHRIPEDAVSRYLLLFIVANMLWLLSAYFTALYIADSSPNYEQFGKRTVRALAIYSVLIVFYVFFSHHEFSRLFIVANIVLFSTLLLSMRGILIAAMHYSARSGKVGKKVVILGYNEVARRLASNFIDNQMNARVEGYFEDSREVHELSLLPIIGNIEDCVPYAISHNVSEIYSTISPETNSAIYEMAHTAEKSLIRFKFVPDFRLYVDRNTHMEYINEQPVLSLRPEPLEDPANSIKKRVFDICMSLFVIVFILSWLTPILAILIKLNSRGPVFFIQPRSGKDNQVFKCFKFRSLSPNSDAHTRQVTRNDNRITPFGKFLRKSNLDELPQFFNVLIGNMSVVGPRPHMLAHTETYSKALEQYMIRHFVKPGVTGWAQVNGLRGEIKGQDQLRNRIEHDIWYLENWSLWLDLRIIFLTVYNTVKGDKNAF